MSGYTLGHRKVFYIGDPETQSLASLGTTTDQPVKYTNIIANYNSDNPFTDPDFPTDNTSIGTIGLDSANSANNYPLWDRTFSWFRASDAVAKTSGATSTQFVYTNRRETFSRMDVRQGTLGDCWFLACASEVSSDQDLIEFIAPLDNTSNNNSGAYHFRLYHFGIWIDVVVDDYLMCAEFFGPGQGWYIVACSPPVTNGVAELWSPLLEKAYAKVNGSYGNIEANEPLVGLEDLTGGLGEQISLSPQNAGSHSTLFHTLQEVTQLRSFLALSSIAPKGNLSKSDFDAVGLHYPHAYSLNSLAVVNYKGVPTQLIRARNPWGKSEWTGAWSDHSPEWNSVDAATKKRIGLVVANDGEFWMSFTDMVKYFTELGICYWVSEDDYAKETKVFRIEPFNGAWSVENNTAGGYQAPWACPQYPITVVGGSSGTGVLLIGMQIDAPITQQTVSPWIVLLYKVGDTTATAPFGVNFFQDPRNYLVESANIKIVEGDPYFTLFETPRATTGFKLDAGTYVIVPSTQSPNSEAQFVIQIVAQKSTASLLSKPDQSPAESLGDLILEA